MVWNFDPRKLVKDQQEEEEKKIEEILSQQEKFDLAKEANEAALRKKSNIKDQLDKAAKAIREVKFAEKFGLDEWAKAKEKEDPDAWKELEDWQDNTVLGKLFNTDKSKTLEEEYGDDQEIKPQFASYAMAGTTGPIEVKSTTDPFAGDVGQLESIGY